MPAHAFAVSGVVAEAATSTRPDWVTASVGASIVTESPTVEVVADCENATARAPATEMFLAIVAPDIAWAVVRLMKAESWFSTEVALTVTAPGVTMWV